jgi:hypothetical protein
MKVQTPAQALTVVLGGICGVLAFVAVLQAFGVGAGYRLAADAPLPLEEDLLQPLQPVEFRLPDFARYAEIAQRPLFHADRRPKPIDPTSPQPVDAVPPPVPLNATLLAVLVDPDLQMVVLRDNQSSAVHRVRKGMPLPGELAGWTLTELEGRRAVFDGGPQGRVELRLDLAKVPSAPPLQAAPPAMAPPPGTAMQQAPARSGQLPTDEAARLAEVQRIIAERRAQMRAEAEKLQQQGKPQ